MSRPDPKYGRVVRFKYLWRREEHEGLSEGEKHRPCAVIVALEPKEGEERKVMLCAISHSPPEPPVVAIEIPAEAKADAGLDEDQNWIVVSEVNKTPWSSGRFQRTNYGKWEYGVLPQEVMNSVRQAIADGIKRGQLDVVNREQIDERIAGNEGAA